MQLIQAQTPAEIDQARELFKEYETELGISLCFQNFEQELAALPGDYAPPDGRLMLAFDRGDLAGCVALRKIGEGVCEMKRRRPMVLRHRSVPCWQQTVELNPKT